MAESALLVVVPEAEPLVAAHRDRHDASARLGIPAHVTLLYPFLAPETIGDEVLGDLAALFAAHRSFAYRLDQTGRFPAAIYLAPEPTAPFVALTRAIWDRYPEAPPYRGEHGSSITPHLTVGQFTSEDEADAFAAGFDAEVRARQPMASRATEVALFDNRDNGYWRQRATFPLGTA